MSIHLFHHGIKNVTSDNENDINFVKLVNHVKFMAKNDAKLNHHMKNAMIVCISIHHTGSTEGT